MFSQLTSLVLVEQGFEITPRLVCGQTSRLMAQNHRPNIQADWCAIDLPNCCPDGFQSAVICI